MDDGAARQGPVVAFAELSDEALIDLLRAEARERDGQLVIEPLDDGWVAAILREQLIDAWRGMSG